MRIVHVIERASSPAMAPQYLAEDENGTLRWTADREVALEFSDRDAAAELFQAHGPVCGAFACIVEHAVNDLTGWAAANVALRERRGEIDAASRREAAAIAA